SIGDCAPFPVFHAALASKSKTRPSTCQCNDLPRPPSRDFTGMRVDSPCWYRGCLYMAPEVTLMRPLIVSENTRVMATIPFVEQLDRRGGVTMPHSIDLGDLVQDGVIGLIDAAHRFDEARAIKFETFAERRIRGAMIDALRKDAWPRGVRRQRRELEAAREQLRRELGCEPSLA